jgi:hypothetical protein
MKRQHKVALFALAVGLMLIPATDAMGVSGSLARERAQNARITRAIKATQAVANKVFALNTKSTLTVKSLTDLTGVVGGIDTRLKTLEAGAPALVSALTQLGTAAQQLKDGLTTVGAGLTQLKTLATSTEYGFGQVLIAQPTIAAEPGSFIETPDIPDTVQQAMTEQQFVAGHTGALVVAYGVRSAESDGTGPSKPAAYCRITVTNASGQTGTTAANANFGGLPFQPVDNKSALTSTDPANAGFPFGLKQSGADADQTTNFVSSVNVTSGQTYTVGMSCVDTSADATDPSA